MQIGNKFEGALDSAVKTRWQSPRHELAPHGAVQPVWPGFLTGQLDVHNRAHAVSVAATDGIL